MNKKETGSKGVLKTLGVLLASTAILTPLHLEAHAEEAIPAEIAEQEVHTEKREGDVLNLEEDALRRAQEFLKDQAYSKLQLREELSFLQLYSELQIDNAMNNINVNWYDQATRFVKELVESSYGYSEVSLINKLVSYRYTYEEAYHAIENSTINWEEEAFKFANRLLDEKTYSEKNLYQGYGGLIYSGFSESQAKAGMAKLSIDWDKQALTRANELLAEKEIESRYDISYPLEWDGFNSDNIKYVFDNISVDWTEKAIKNAEGMELVSKEYWEDTFDTFGYFTEDEIIAAAASVGIDWNDWDKHLEKALDSKLTEGENATVSKKVLINKLAQDGFTEDKVVAAVDSKNLPWKQYAQNAAKSYLNRGNVSKYTMVGLLEADGFTKEEAQQAADTLIKDGEEVPEETPEEESRAEEALNRAKELLSEGAYSRSGLIAKLMDENYSYADAAYGVDTTKTDWVKQATIKAKNALEETSYSKEDLIDTLSYTGHTSGMIYTYGFDREIAEEAVESLNLDWVDQAKKSAKEYLGFSYSYKSRQGLIDSLMSIGKYTEEEATYGTDASGTKWEDNAWFQAMYYLRSNHFLLTKEALITRLEQDGFTNTDINYALESISNNLGGVMWVEQIQINAKARNYAILDYYSRQNIVKTLLSHGITKVQADKAVGELVVDWKENALITLQSILDRNKDYKTGRYIVSKRYCETSLKADHFTDAEIKYALNSVDINWEKHDQELLALFKEQAKGYGISYIWHEFGLRLGYSFEETHEVFEINRKEEAVSHAYHYFRNSINYSKEGLESFLDYLYSEDEIAHAVKVVWGTGEINAEIEEAIRAVEKAEATSLQTDVNSAKLLIDALADSTDKESLFTRLELVQLMIDKEIAKSALTDYKDSADYAINADTFKIALSAGKTAIDEATTPKEVDSALAEAKKALDGLVTDAEITAEKLIETKNSANKELENYKDSADYAINADTFKAALSAGKKVINEATTTKEVENALAEAKKALDGIQTDSIVEAERLIKAKKDAKTELSEFKSENHTENLDAFNAAIKAGEKAIDQAKTVNEVENALAETKTAIDEIPLNAGVKVGWIKEENKWYYYDSKGVMQTGWTRVAEELYNLNADGSMFLNPGWNKIDNQWYYQANNGSMEIAWTKVNNTWYFMDNDAVMQTGWTEVADTWYYMNSSGVMQTGWNKLGNSWYYMASGGAMQTGWTKVGNNQYYMKDNGAMQTGWQKIAEKWFYLNSDGSMHLKPGWNKIGNNWYYQLSNGGMQTGWTKVGNNWYYMDNGGVMQTGWTQIGNTWYYMTSSGAMQTGWTKVGNNWYYMTGSGAMQTGWTKVGNNWYYMTASGAMQTGWTKVGSNWYYMDSSGAMKPGLQKINNKWYYMDASGAMQTGITHVGNKVYYLYADGSMLLNLGWNKIGGNWYYQNLDAVLVTNWNKIGNTWYYMDENGAMQTEWTNVGDTWYYMSSGGAMQTGWTKVGNTWYYMSSSGAMQTGWIKLGNDWYYLNENGSMQTEEIEIEGKIYSFDSAGRMK